MPIALDHGSPRLVTWRAGVTLNAALVAGTIFSVVTAGLHAKGWAPVGLASLALGGAVGCVAFAGAWMFAYGHRRGIVVLAVLAGLFAAALQHNWLYLAYVNQWRAARMKDPHWELLNPDAEPLGVKAYFQREITPQRAALWGVDLALTALAAGTAAHLLRRRFVFCGVCDVWYQLRWQGKLIDSPVLTDLAAPPEAQSRLFACPQGCTTQLMLVKWNHAGEPHRHLEWIDSPAL